MNEAEAENFVHKFFIVHHIGMPTAEMDTYCEWVPELPELPELRKTFISDIDQILVP